MNPLTEIHPFVESYWSDLFSSTERLGFTLYNSVAVYGNFLLSQAYPNAFENMMVLDETMLNVGYLQAKNQLADHGIVKMTDIELIRLFVILNIFLGAFKRTDVNLSYFGIVANVFYDYIYLRDPTSYNPSGKFDGFLPKLIQGFKNYSLGNMIAMAIFFVCASIMEISVAYLPRFLYHLVAGYLTHHFALQYVEKLI
ncbi:UNKNOWN [Stylonychia lemnae]|uniref:Uncharacterized protein n=1 Tax=Stylonychia lemnae TaxID=5949 RepID=A0A078AYH4_STYLE|nr:UNKNOWN [Stylonychia lemnae]|eukprot:CDW87465.1 UNKNOWN [Stylonychia lemnae]